MAARPITVSKLIKQLLEIRAKYGPRTKVSIAKDTLWDGNGTFNICDAVDAVPIWVRLCDGDGFTETTQLGVERGSTQVVIRGIYRDECRTLDEQDRIDRKSKQLAVVAASEKSC